MAGEAPDEPAPSPTKLVAWLPNVVFMAGILGWSTGALDDLVGAGMMAAGVAGSALLSKLSPADNESAA